MPFPSSRQKVRSLLFQNAPSLATPRFFVRPVNPLSEMLAVALVPVFNCWNTNESGTTGDNSWIGQTTDLSAWHGTKSGLSPGALRVGSQRQARVLRVSDNAFGAMSNFSQADLQVNLGTGLRPSGCDMAKSGQNWFEALSACIGGRVGYKIGMLARTVAARKTLRAVALVGTGGTEGLDSDP